MLAARILRVVRNIGIAGLCLFLAVAGPAIAESGLLLRFFHYSHVLRTALWEETLIGGAVAFVLGLSLYWIWRTEIAKWMWVAGVAWLAPHGLAIFLPGQHSVLESAGSGSAPEWASVLNWGNFVIPCLRTIFFSAGAWCGALFLVPKMSDPRPVGARIRGDGEPVDSRIEVIVDPNFAGDVVALAAARCVWIVDSPGNQQAIDAAWQYEKECHLCEVSRCKVENPENREESLLTIMGLLENAYRSYSMNVYGLDADAELQRVLSEGEGFESIEATPDGFVALRAADWKRRNAEASAS